jgi:hypothetical protein
VTAYDVRPPSCGGARYHHDAPTTATVSTIPTALTIRRRIVYWVATTVSWVAAAAVACGDVVVQETLPEVFVHEYHEPPDASWIFTVVAAVGLIVKVTESMFCGFDALRL